jgi:hypothetical protein
MKAKATATGDIDKAYDKASSSGKRAIEHYQQFKNEIVGRYRKRTGRGSSIRIKPTERGQIVNGRFVWTKL